MDSAPIQVEFREADQQWVVRRPNASRAPSVHSSRQAADRAGRTLGRRRRCDVIVPGHERAYAYADVPQNGSRLHRPPRPIHD